MEQIGESRLTRVYRQSVDGRQFALKVYGRLRMERLKSYDFEQMRYTDGREFLARELAAYALLSALPSHEQFVPRFYGETADEQSVGLRLELADGPLMAFDDGRGAYIHTELGAGLADPRRRAIAAREMLEALCFLHKQGLAHLDLKPDNFLSFAGRLKLIDFNCARPFAADARHRLSYGTFFFAAPETFFKLDEGYDPFKADVWAFGACVFAAAEQRLPFAEGDEICPPQIAYELATLNSEPVFARATAAERALIRRAMTKEADKRPSAEELLTEPLLAAKS